MHASVATASSVRFAMPWRATTASVASRSMSCNFEVVCFMDEEYRPVGLVSTVRSVCSIEGFHRENIVPPSKFFDLFTHHRPVLPAIVQIHVHRSPCLLYTSDAADERSSVDLGGRRII